MSRRSRQRTARKLEQAQTTISELPLVKNEKTTTIRLWSFFKKHWAIIISLLIASSGGVPGIISTWKSIFDKPKIIFHFGPSDTGDTPYELDDSYGVCFMSLIIANTGNKPLLPLRFKAYLKYDDKETEMTGLVMPADSIVLRGDDKKVLLRAGQVKQKDLQLLKKLSPDESINGFLFFGTSKEFLDDFTKSSNEFYRVVIVDLFNNEYDSGYVSIRSTQAHELYYPKEGLTTGR